MYFQRFHLPTGHLSTQSSYETYFDYKTFRFYKRKLSVNQSYTQFNIPMNLVHKIL